MQKNIFQILTFLISTTTALGVFLHDGRIDKASTISFKVEQLKVINPEIDIKTKLAEFIHADAHTHPDHNAAKSSLVNGLAYQSPSVPPRGTEEKKHMLQKFEGRGRHAFDNYNLPVLVD